ncbi:MAG TPA: DUF1987 domain-containing protein [Candidatus Cloacimonas sp.]|jgi:hypothetical protein|nr:DUF1987 domain-containing protein [Candidatus Cloacimonas sp.]
MENFIITNTKYTPQIELSFKDRYLRIIGDSYPENAMDVYQPLIVKLEKYFEAPAQDLLIEFNFDFVSTSSKKMLTDIIGILQGYHDAGHQIKLTWFFPEGDLDWQEQCEMFLEDASFNYSITPFKD